MTSSLILQLFDRVSGPARGISGALARIRGQTSRFNQSQAAGMAMAGGFGRRLLAMGGAYIGVDQGIRRTVGASIKFEEAFADVRKVVNGSEEQLSNIRRQIIDMSKVLPTSTEGIAAIFAAAGQSNVPIEELGRFSEMVAKVAVAWDTTEGETSDSLAKIKTQLHMSVGEVGLLADAMNHLSNNSAARAPNLVEYMKRVAATGEMFGFAATQTLAFGGAMVAAGGETEVAATSFRNMGRALTMGARATKQQRVGYKALGLDAVKTAKNMQKNALGTTLDVLERIQKLPEWQRISIASALFGDEARALMPVINNSTELRRQLGLVGDQANYAGSAFREYMVRADTAANALQIIGNKVKATFLGIGDSMLPTIKEAGLGIGDVLDTLGERAGIIDRVQASVQGFVKGLGYDGGVRETVNAIGDLLFGKADGAGAADQLGRLFEQFRQGGAAIREFWDANKDSPVAKFLGQISGYGFSLFVASTGIVMVAGAVMKLARALMILSGASAAIGILKSLVKVGGLLFGGGAAGVATASGATAATWGGFAAALSRWFSRIGAGASGGLFAASINAAQSRAVMSEEEQERNDYINKRLREHFDNTPTEDHPWRKFFFGAAADPGFSLRNQMGMNTAYGSRAGQGSGGDVAAVLRDSVIQTRPTGTQDVKVTNPVRPNVTVSVTVNATTNADPAAIGRAVGERVRGVVEGTYGDVYSGL